MRIFQKGFNYSQDGFGNRLVYHLQGCNMHCPWCSNPEGMKQEGVLMTDEEWLLDSVCPKHAIKEGKLDRTFCAGCQEKECVTQHRTKGIRLSYEEMSVESIVDEVLANSPMFYDKGGVTFTGGEATIQLGELLSVCKLLRECGIHTALETNGSHPKLKRAFPFVSQLIMDCKLCDEEKHKKAVGISNAAVMENIRLAAAEHPCVHIRVPLIGGINDSKEDIREFLDFFQEIGGGNVTFEILAYHEFGRKKWEQCGFSYQMTDRAHVNAAAVRRFQDEIVRLGLKYMRT
ncbi:glycyl-radical enzyme activating protein [Luxibacter massiliensis]|uniref:glycyl-radical enzyme activating protein n=1 Tax=Luxibacter massiliensis TaxID=2219695 RepID=UPI000F05CC82|nr:glycyl-radical enzyme activating protein [Luxibacter massiliensis]